MDTGTIAEAITKAVARDGPDPNENMRLAFELKKARKAGMPESMIERVLAMAAGDAGAGAVGSAEATATQSKIKATEKPAAALSMNDVMEGIKQAVESGGADPSSNMRLQFVMQKAREGGVEESMLERVLSMVSASAAPSPAPLGSAPVARVAAAPVDDEDEEPELTEEDLAAMRQDVLESITESVQRSGRDLSQNLKLGFMLKRASGMGIPDTEIEEALGGPIPTGTGGGSAGGAPSKPPPVASGGAVSMNDVMEGIKQAVESGGADPSSNMRLQFVMQKAREGGVEESMLERVLSMVSASAAPSPAPLGSAPVARVAAAPVDDEDEEPELTEEDLAAMRQDVLESITESVQRSGRDLSQNLKLGFMLKRASGMGIPDTEIEEALGGPIPTGTGGGSAGGAPSKPPPVASGGAVSMNDVMEGIKQAVESGGADPSSNMRLQFVMQKAREGGVEESMLERVLSMVSASAAPSPAPLGSAPVARAAAAPVDDEDEEPELTEEDLAAMRQDVLESITESVQRSGRDLSQNLKLGFMLKRASGMGIPDTEIEEALGGPIPSGTGGGSAGGAPSKPPPVASGGAVSMNDVMEGIKQAVESGGADPSSNMRLQFVMQKAREGGVEESMLERVLSMVSASAAPSPAPLGSAPVARAAAAPVDDEDEESELTEEDLAAMRQDVLESITESVQRSGRDLSQNLKLGFMLKRASGMGIPDTEIEEALGGPIPTGTGGGSAGGAPSKPPPVASGGAVSMNDVMEGIKQAVESGGADPSSNMRLQFVMQKAREGGVEESMLERVLSMVSASAAPSPAPLGSAPVARVAAAPVDDEDEEPELTEEDLAAMRQDVLESITESVQRSGRDLSQNLKLGFMLKRASGMGIPDTEIEEALGGPIPTGTGGGSAGGAPSKPPPVAAKPAASSISAAEAPAAGAVQHAVPPAPIPVLRATDVVVGALMPVSSQQELIEMKTYQRSTAVRLRTAAEKLGAFNDDSEQLYSELGPKFAAKGKQLHGIKNDLDVIFERIRAIKSELGERFPNALQQAEQRTQDEFRSKLKAPRAPQ